MDRIAQLNAYLAASLDGNGRARLGLSKRVDAIRAELARLDAQAAKRTLTPVNPPG